MTHEHSDIELPEKQDTGALNEVKDEEQNIEESKFMDENSTPLEQRENHNNDEEDNITVDNEDNIDVNNEDNISVNNEDNIADNNEDNITVNNEDDTATNEDNITVNNEGEEDDEDDDNDSEFGTFDEASFEDLSFDEPTSTAGNDIDNQDHENSLRFTEEVFEEKENFNNSLNHLMELLFPVNLSEKSVEHNSSELLNPRSSEVFQELSALPHLKPPKWIKLKIRHNLLIELGIPINLDEISNDHHNNVQTTKHSFKNINKVEEDIDWSKYNLPKDLKLSVLKKNELLDETTEILSRIETDNLTNSSRQHLESCSEELLDAKLNEYNANYDTLVQLGLVYVEKFEELKENFEIYENVIQNYIGNSQKLRREEILEKLNKLKLKGKKSRSTRIST